MLKLFLPEREERKSDCEGVNKRYLQCRGAPRQGFWFFSPRPFRKGEFFMQSRVAIISIMVEDRTQAANINALLSQFGEYIVGRMGIPYKAKNVNIMCVVADAPTEVLNTITGKIGRLTGVTAKTLMGKL